MPHNKKQPLTEISGNSNLRRTERVLRRSLTSDDDDDDDAAAGYSLAGNDYVHKAGENDDDNCDGNTLRSMMRTGRLRRMSSRYSLRARSLKERWRFPITSQQGMDGAVESAMGGMLIASQSVSSSRGTSPRKTGHVERVEEAFGLARPIMSGIRARIGVLRGRAETAPAKLESMTTPAVVGNGRARFIAGDELGAYTPVRLMEPSGMLSDGWRWSVC